MRYIISYEVGDEMAWWATNTEPIVFTGDPESIEICFMMEATEAKTPMFVFGGNQFETSEFFSRDRNGIDYYIPPKFYTVDEWFAKKMKLDHCHRASCVQIIEVLTKERDRLAAENERLKAWKDSTWQRGHAVGIAGLNDATSQMSQAKEAYLEENERLTNLLLKTEADKERLAAENEGLVATVEVIRKWNPCSNFNEREIDRICAAALAKVKESGK